jgi:hypothetical protein
VEWCGHQVKGIPVPDLDRRWRQIRIERSHLIAGVYAELQGFALAHRACGQLYGDVDPLERDGYRVWATCSCGARLERWVNPG